MVQQKQVQIFSRPSPSGSPVPGGISTLITVHDSLLGFVQYCQKHDPHSGNAAEVKGYATATSVVTSGWPEVLGKLVQVEQETRKAFAPVRSNPWGYTGGRVSIDRMLAGKPCISRPVRQVKPSDKFVRIVFVGEAMACAGGENFVRKCAELLGYIRTVQGKGMQVELWGAWGGRNVQGCISLVKVKGFTEQINMPILSGIGHQTLLRTCQFGSERVVTQNDAYPMSFAHPDAYREALAYFVGTESAKSATVVCNIHEIDPKKWLAKVEKNAEGKK